MRAASADAPPFNPSQTSANSGASKRTTSNGQQVVLDSDDDSLPDLDFGLPTPKVKTIVTTTTTRSKRMSEDQENGLQKPAKKAKDNKNKFDVLVKTAHKNLETERQIKEHSALLDQSLEEHADTTLALNEELLGQAVDDDDDPEKSHRLLQAMQRTNATQMESVYHFFQDDSDSIQAQPKFPLSSLTKHGWVSILKDSYARDQAFMTGFAQQIFRMQQLPEELASWMIECISRSRNEALSYRYIEILESEPHNKHLLYPVSVDVELSDPKLPDMIHQYLDQSSNFRIDKDTDYEHLTARLTLLDIAIGPGLLNVPYQPLSSPTTSETGSSPVRAPVPASSEVKDFNNEVDALARQFQLLSNSIIEAGAAVDLTIMDAKDSIERLRARLEHAVRIGGKKVYNVFGDEDEHTQPNLRRFFKSTGKDAPKKSIFDEEDDVAVSLADDSKA
ncbi:hypothetical protein J4E90_007336 [Alternaria incomplexa]|uniref:uncharacterized protein n=1 Tax=Alternaria incomplexa TaxID=1187928 RepID=UPI00221F2B30|nr:uncharacterized protein J4E90_007336 [Alternaria incomplexa]KAI4911079.1 hypothetical protein J4E90_007336 [Alternaria incomplexa]